MSKFFRLAAPAVLLVAVGCTQRSTEVPQTRNDANQPAPQAGHSHGDPPHGGTLADWGGGKYHVEFTVDHDADSAKVYILGDDAQTAVPVSADKLLLSIDDPAFQVELTPDPLPGEANGMSSRFIGQHENLGIVREFSGTISGEVDGTPYAGDFKEVAGEHGHEH